MARQDTTPLTSDLPSKQLSHYERYIVVVNTSNTRFKMSSHHPHKMFLIALSEAVIFKLLKELKQSLVFEKLKQLPRHGSNVGVFPGSVMLC